MIEHRLLKRALNVIGTHRWSVDPRLRQCCGTTPEENHIKKAQLNALVKEQVVAHLDGFTVNGAGAFRLVSQGRLIHSIRLISLDAADAFVAYAVARSVFLPPGGLTSELAEIGKEYAEGGVFSADVGVRIADAAQLHFRRFRSVEATIDVLRAQVEKTVAAGYTATSGVLESLGTMEVGCGDIDEGSAHLRSACDRAVEIQALPRASRAGVTLYRTQEERIRELLDATPSELPVVLERRRRENEQHPI